VGKAGLAGVKTVLGVASVVDPLLLPGPLDALGLLVKTFGAYGEAREAIRSQNTRQGFAEGLSASLRGWSLGAVRKHLARWTDYQGAGDWDPHNVGVAERSHLAGLEAGFDYGGQLSDDARHALLRVGFAALQARGTLPPERGERWAAETHVWQLAGALAPSVDQIFEAMQAQAEKEAHLKYWKERSQRYLESGVE
jgi:hypothetical protein